MKMIRILVCAIAAAVSGWFLYNGAELLFFYRDLRQSSLLVASGVALAVLYVWNIWLLLKRDKLEKVTVKRNVRAMLCSGMAYGMAAAGMAVYVMRYRGKMWILSIAVMVFAVTFLLDIVMTEVVRRWRISRILALPEKISEEESDGNEQ